MKWLFHPQGCTWWEKSSAGGEI